MKFRKAETFSEAIEALGQKRNHVGMELWLHFLFFFLMHNFPFVVVFFSNCAFVLPALL